MIELNVNLNDQGLIALPALIDPHVHFRTPGYEYKEDWITGASAALSGGVTQVCDMPNTNPPCICATSVKEKFNLIRKQLDSVNNPLDFRLYLGINSNTIDDIPLIVDMLSSTMMNDLNLLTYIVGLKLFLGSSTNSLLVYKQKDLENIFSLCAKHNLLLAIHAEDEKIINNNKQKYQNATNPSYHNLIRHKDAAISSVNLCINLANKYKTKIYLLHISTKEELELIRSAKANDVNVFAETTPHHLFLCEGNIDTQGTKVIVNPPLRSKSDQNALWKAINDGTIDTIGSDHAPHTLDEKLQPYPQTPAGLPGIETTLPLLFTAFKEGKLTLDTIVKLTRLNPQKILGLPANDDLVLINPNYKRKVIGKNLKTKCKWSPYEDKVLYGWPKYVICNNQLIDLQEKLHDPN